MQPPLSAPVFATFRRVEADAGAATASEVTTAPTASMPRVRPRRSNICVLSRVRVPLRALRDHLCTLSRTRPRPTPAPPPNHQKPPAVHREPPPLLERRECRG